jgi:ribonuclease D
MEWGSTITPQDLASLPIRRYEGEVRLVAAQAELERELEAIAKEGVLGFDTETRPAFRKGESYPPALVQLAGESVVWVCQLRALASLAGVAAIFEDAGIVKAGIGTADDLRQLAKLVAFTGNNVVDVGALAKRRGIGQTGLRNLAGIVLGFRIPKGKRTSNWAAARLTRQQIAYAAMDAWAARALYLALAR